MKRILSFMALFSASQGFIPQSNPQSNRLRLRKTSEGQNNKSSDLDFTTLAGCSTAKYKFREMNRGIDKFNQRDTDLIEFIFENASSEAIRDLYNILPKLKKNPLLRKEVFGEFKNLRDALVLQQEICKFIDISLRPNDAVIETNPDDLYKGLN